MLYPVLEPVLWPLTNIFVGGGPRTPRSYDYLVDENGDFLTDENANLLTE